MRTKAQFVGGASKRPYPKNPLKSSPTRSSSKVPVGVFLSASATDDEFTIPTETTAAQNAPFHYADKIVNFLVLPVDLGNATRIV